MAVLVGQDADPRPIPGNQRLLGGCESFVGTTPGLLRGVKPQQELIETVYLSASRAIVSEGHRLPNCGQAI